MADDIVALRSRNEALEREIRELRAAMAGGVAGSGDHEHRQAATAATPAASKLTGDPGDPQAPSAFSSRDGQKQGARRRKPVPRGPGGGALQPTGNVARLRPVLTLIDVADSDTLGDRLYRASKRGYKALWLAQMASNVLVGTCVALSPVWCYPAVGVLTGLWSTGSAAADRAAEALMWLTTVTTIAATMLAVVNSMNVTMLRILFTNEGARARVALYVALRLVYSVAAVTYFAAPLNVAWIVCSFVFTCGTTCLEDARHVHMMLRRPENDVESMSKCGGKLFTILYQILPWLVEIGRHFAVLYIPPDRGDISVQNWIHPSLGLGAELRFTNLQAMNTSFSAVIVIAWLNGWHSLRTSGHLARMFRVKVQIVASHHRQKTSACKRQLFLGKIGGRNIVESAFNDKSLKLRSKYGRREDMMSSIIEKNSTLVMTSAGAHEVDWDLIPSSPLSRWSCADWAQQREESSASIQKRRRSSGGGGGIRASILDALRARSAISPEPPR